MADDGDTWSAVFGCCSSHTGSMCSGTVVPRQDASTEQSTVFLIWWWVSGDSWGAHKVRHWWLRSPWTCSALQMDLDDPRIASEALFGANACVQNFSFLFWWAGLLCFRLKVVNPPFISRSCVLQQVIMLCFVLLWKFLAYVQVSFLLFRSQFSRHPSCGHFV